MQSSGKPDFFVSYNKADRGWAEWIAWELEEAKYVTVLQAWDFRPGQNFVLQMQHSTVEAERTLVVVSPDYLSALFTQPEWAAAFAGDPMGREGKVIPVRVRDCAPQGLLSQIIHVNLVGLSETEAREALRAGVRKERVKPPVPPSFPGQAWGGRKVPAFPGPPRCLGRDGELEAIVASVCCQLPAPVPVLGPPGVGRTTVALAVLHDLRVVERFGERRWFVRCEGTASRGELAAKIAQGLGLAAGPLWESELLAELQLRPALLVLDEAEIPWEAEMIQVEALLSELAALKTLALVVALRGEQRPFGICWREAVRLGPLELSAARDAFLAVAGETFRQDPHLDRLLEAVDRLPLAVAMLAHQAEAQPNLEGLWLGWKSQRTAMLRRGKVAALEVSLTLAIGSPRMTADARRLLSLLGSLPDGVARCDLDVLLPGEASEAAATLRRVGLAFDRGTRLRLLSPVREYVRREHLPAPEDLDRVIDHFLDLARLEERFSQETGEGTPRLLLHDAGNLEAMIRLGLGRTDVAPAVRAAVALTDVLLLAGQDASHLLVESCRASRESELLPETAACLRRLGDVALVREEAKTADERYEEARALYRRLGDVLGEAHCVKALGDVALARAEPDPEAARSLFRKALSLYRRAEDLSALARCLENLAELAFRQSSYGIVRDHHLEAQLLYQRAQDPLSEAACLKVLGDIALLEHLCQVADFRYRKALSLFRRTGHALCEAVCLRNLGDVALERMDPEAARDWYEQALILYESLENLSGQAGCLRRLGDVAMASADPGMARALYGEALDLYRRRTPTPGAAWCARRLGDIALSERDYSTARELYEEGLRLYHCTSNLLGEIYCASKLAEIALAQFGEMPGGPEPTYTDFAWVARTRSYHREVSIIRVPEEPGPQEKLMVTRASVIRGLNQSELAHILYKVPAAQEELTLGMSFLEVDQSSLFDRFEQVYGWIRRSTPNLLAEAQARQDLGRVALARLDYESARSYYEEATIVFQRLGFPLGEAECLRRLGDIAMVLGRAGTARVRYEAALELYQNAHGRLGQAYCLKMLGRASGWNAPPRRRLS